MLDAHEAILTRESLAAVLGADRRYGRGVRHAEFRDPRLVTVYDAECPWSRDDDFFLAVVDSVADQNRVLDLGCGTGRLALVMAAAGYPVTGVDPSRASVAAARSKPGAERVTWIEGYVEAAPRVSVRGGRAD